MNMARLSKLYALVLVVFYPAAMLLGADKIEPAHFIVTNEILTPNIQPFTVTIGPFGNGGRLTGQNSGFEPVIYSTRYIASKGTWFLVRKKLNLRFLGIHGIDQM